MNPDDVKPVNGFYPSEIAEKIKNYMFIMIFIVAGCSAIGTIFTFPYKEDIHDVDTERAFIAAENATEEEEVENPYGNSLKNALLSRQFIILYIFSMCSLCK